MILLHASVPTHYLFFFFFNDTATTEIYTLSLHDALPIFRVAGPRDAASPPESSRSPVHPRGSAGNAAWPDRGPVRPSRPARPDARSAAPPASPPSPTACWDARRSRR